MTAQPRELKIQEDLICVSKYLMGGNEEDKDRIFLVPRHGTGSNAHKLKHMKLYPNMRLLFFSVKCWNRLPKEVFKS